jgi:hypothetical protein
MAMKAPDVIRPLTAKELLFVDEFMGRAGWL